ncbi:MAG: hypothetical protein AAGD07_04085 [Planctomycetota bacterium]
MLRLTLIAFMFYGSMNAYQVAKGNVLTYQLEGEVLPSRNLGFAEDPFEVGMGVSILLSYDTSSSDSEVDPAIGLYDDAITEYSMNFGDGAYTATFVKSNFARVSDPRNLGDNIWFSAFVDGADVQSQVGVVSLRSSGVQFFGPDEVLNGDSLVALPNHTAWSLPTDGLPNFAQSKQGGLNFGGNLNDQVRVNFVISSYSQVPAPSSVIGLYGLSLVGILAFRRKR